ncbi:MAG: M48 family metalloprotease [Candidatus Acidiferrales bacterium]
MTTDHTMGLAGSSAGERFLPRDRESFFEAQRRNRHATWRLSTVAVLASVIMGIPLALTITPLLYAAALIVADIVNVWMPLPAVFWHRADEIAQYGLSAFHWLLQPNSGSPPALAIGLCVLLLPGAALSVGLWLGVNALFRRAGVGGALLALKAREPNQSDLKELQLADVVQEMAIASGLPAPRIMLIDTSAANAAAIGTSPDDARIVVSRGLIERLSRDELEGALAHLVASIGNGDLRIAFRVTSVFETCGLLVAVINSPFGSRSRSTLWRIVRYGLGRNVGEASAQEAAAVATLLTRGADMGTDDIDDLFTPKKKSVLRSIRNVLLFPIFFTNAAIKLSLWFFSFSMLEPSMALLWRKRKYLADACAVQMTRNPDGLAEALRKLNADRGPIPGGAWAAHLFLVSPAGSDRVNDPKADSEQKQALARIWMASAPATNNADPDPAAARATANPLVIAEIVATGRAAMAGDQTAVARMMAFRQAAATALGKPVDELPDVSDFIAAQHGDKAALHRLQQFDHSMNGRQPEADSKESSESSSSNFAGFFPSLRRRLKRLDRMGAHVELEADDGKSWIIIAALSIILGPFALAALVLLVLLIAIMVMASVAFLTIWMAVIHKLFLVFLHH